MTENEKELYGQAKEAVLSRVVEAATRGTTAKAVLELAEAYAVLVTRTPAGRIDVPKH